MKSEALINVCQAAMHGSERHVRNLKDHREGKVISCSSAGLEVEVGTRKELWSFEECEVMETESVLRSA